LRKLGWAESHHFVGTLLYHRQVLFCSAGAYFRLGRIFPCR
jgi:hypothetical protein